MDTTASSFTLRKNAKRAAEEMIRKGTTPAVDYGIKPSDDGRFEIAWKSPKTAPTTDEVETEIAEAPANQPAAASPTEDASQHAPAATERATARPTIAILWRNQSARSDHRRFRRAQARRCAASPI